MRPGHASFLAAAALASAQPAVAQPAPAPTTSPFGAAGEDRILPQTSYPLGRSESVAQGLAASLQVERVKRKLCEELGCLVIRNDSRNYSVTGFFVKMPAMLGTDRWGPNQLDSPLRPSFSLLKVKTGGADACALPVRFELKKRRSGERAAIIAEGNFCATPGQTNVLSIRVVTPQVSVEQGS
jgi:hypothetical protein